MAPTKPTRGSATEPATALGPVLGQHIAEDTLGLGELGIVERVGPIDAKADLPRCPSRDDLAVVEDATRTSASLLANADAGADAWHACRGRVGELPRRAT